VSQTSDPSGGWYLYSVSPGFSSAPRLDFPILGFNKNWIVITINAYTSGGAFSKSGVLIASYPNARAGTLSSTTSVNLTSARFCVAPCVTLSAEQDTLYLVTHSSSSGATLYVDRITGTATPTYTTGTAYTRPGGGWVQPSGQQLPQSAPNAGTSACSPPCPIEIGDSYVRSAPTYRVDATSGRGYIYYTQTVGLPSSGQTHTGIQWTKLTAGLSAGSPTSANAQFADGGRIEDATATATNGGKWYAFPHIAVNALGDFLVGYSQFSSAQHPSAGYSYHDHTDPAGTMRDPYVYKAGEDYYHKDYGGGRNRWGDFTTAQVDPSDDQTLWVLQEYAKNRTSTDDGATGANGSRWGTAWAAVNIGPLSFTITASAGAGGTISPSGNVVVTQGASPSFTITPDDCYGIADVVVDGVSQGPLASYTFPNVQGGHTISATFARDTYTITASTDGNGVISPAGATTVDCGTDASFTITPNSGYYLTSLVVDGSSVTPAPGYTFPNVRQGHTIEAGFSLDQNLVTAVSSPATLSPSHPCEVIPVTLTRPGGSAVGSFSASFQLSPELTLCAGLASVAEGGFLSGSGPVLFNVVAGGGGLYTVTGSLGAGCGPTALTGTLFTIGVASGSPTGPGTITLSALDLRDCSNAALPMAIGAPATVAIDNLAPAVAVSSPNGGEALDIGASFPIAWTATDAAGIDHVVLLLSRTGAGGAFDTLATGLANSPPYDWPVTGPTTSDAFLRVVALDVFGNEGADLSDAAFSIGAATGVEGGTPVAFALQPVMPNPARGNAVIRYALPRTASIRLTVVDLQGREIAVLAQGTREAGTFQAQWNGATPTGRAGAGVYFVRFQTPERSFARRFVLVH
jgi:hypothetical protein